MKIPCFEHQLTKKEPHYNPEAEKDYWDGSRLVVSPETAKKFYNWAKTLFEQGNDFPATLDKIAARTGLRYSTIAKIIDANKTAKKMTNDAWWKQAQYRQVKTAARIYAENASTPEWINAGEKLWDLSRRAAVGFHGGVLPFTHALQLALGTNAERKIWLGMVKNAYAFATPKEIGLGRFKVPFGKGEVRWEKAWDDMVKSDEFKEAVRYGVEAKPGDRPVGILTNLSQGWGIRAFDALKFGRVQLFHLLKDYAEGRENYFLPKGLTDIAKKAGLKSEPRELDEQGLRALAKEVNIATGAMHMQAGVARVAGAVSFAPKLWITKRLAAYTPIRYFAKLGRMTPTERMAANLSLKRWARMVVVSAALLKANDFVNQMIGSKHRVNFTDLSSPGTLWRMNWGGHIIPFSPLLEILRAPVVALGAAAKFRRELHGEEPEAAAIEIFTREMFNALHPSILGAFELYTGREAFGVPRHHRRLPFPGATQLMRGEDPTEREQPMSWTEYMAGKGPIPIASFAREIFSPALQEEGVPKKDADAWITAILSGTTGTHTFEVSPKAAPQRTRYKRAPGTIR